MSQIITASIGFIMGTLGGIIGTRLHYDKDLIKVNHLSSVAETYRKLLYSQMQENNDMVLKCSYIQCPKCGNICDPPPYKYQV